MAWRYDIFTRLRTGTLENEKGEAAFLPECAVMMARQLIETAQDGGRALLSSIEATLVLQVSKAALIKSARDYLRGGAIHASHFPVRLPYGCVPHTGHVWERRVADQLYADWRERCEAEYQYSETKRTIKLAKKELSDAQKLY